MHLQHFANEEFRDWADEMSPRLTVLLDVLRFQLGSAIEISEHPDSLGRELGNKSESEHNIDLWGEVLAADFFVAGVYYRAQAENVVDLARKLGFTGIGVYTDTRNNKGQEQVMFHLGVRPTRKMGDPATWGRIGGKYVSLVAAVQSLAAR